MPAKKRSTKSSKPSAARKASNKVEKARRAYMTALYKRGIVSGVAPGLSIHHLVRPLLDAIYVVLSGGDATAQISPTTNAIQKKADELRKLENTYIDAGNSAVDWDALLLNSI